MVGKGVDYYSYLSSTPLSVQFEFPDDWGKKTKSDNQTTVRNMYHANDQITESDIGALSHTGKYQWTALQGSANIGSRYVDIAPSTGNMGDNNMGNMLSTPSIIGSNYAVSYGFYDAGAGIGSLTNQDQSYVYATTNFANWMSDLVSANAKVGTAPFHKFALPATHDTGMFDTTEVSKLLTNASFLGLLGGLLGFAATSLSTTAVMRSVINLAFTQKDNITTMLNLGIRYFDFRPGYITASITSVSGIYHQHSFIPGYPYDSFLQDVLNWLKAHPREIVVINLNFQGFKTTGMQPTTSTLQSHWTSALTATGTQQLIVPGNKSDLGTSYNDLIAQNKRVIFLNQVGASDDATKYDSYNSNTYQTTNVNNIIGALNGMSASEQPKYDYTVLQLQGTANGTGGEIFKSIATLSDASSPLMSTKANFDHSTYPWLLSNVATKFSSDQLIIFLNDFADNALADYAQQITLQRT